MKNKSTIAIIVIMVSLALTASAVMFYQGRKEPLNSVKIPAVETAPVTNPKEDLNKTAVNDTSIDTGTFVPANETDPNTAKVDPTNPMPPINNPNDAIPIIPGDISATPTTPAQNLEGLKTCDQSCQAVGYAAGYCGKWIENRDNTITECQSGEYTLDPYLYDSLTLKDCVYAGSPLDKIKTICCCKGEPKNDPDCPAIVWPTEPTSCIEQPGYLKNPANGKCCWYKATCYGPDNWTEFKTKAECQAK